jgi:hypothetical protein
MVLTITLSQELQRRLTAEANRRRQGTEALAHAILEEWLTEQSADSAAAYLAELPRPSREEIQAILQAQGAKPVERFEDLLADWSANDGDAEFDVDRFLRARRAWQWEGAPGFGEARAAVPPDSPGT